MTPPSYLHISPQYAMHRNTRSLPLLVSLNQSRLYGYFLMVPLAPYPSPIFSIRRDRRLYRCVKHVLSSRHSFADKVQPTCLSSMLSHTPSLRLGNVPASSMVFSSISYPYQLRQLPHSNTVPLQYPHLSSLHSPFYPHTTCHSH